MKKIIVLLFSVFCLCGCDINIDRGYLTVEKETQIAAHNLSKYEILLLEKSELVARRLYITAPTGTYRIGDTLTLTQVRHE